MELLKELWYTHMSEARTVENKDSITLFFHSAQATPQSHCSIKLASIGKEP